MAPSRHASLPIDPLPTDPRLPLRTSFFTRPSPLPPTGSAPAFRLSPPFAYRPLPAGLSPFVPHGPRTSPTAPYQPALRLRPFLSATCKLLPSAFHQPFPTHPCKTLASAPYRPVPYQPPTHPYKTPSPLSPIKLVSRAPAVPTLRGPSAWVP